MAKAGTGGKLYGSVTSKDVAEAVKDQLSVDIDRKSVLLEESLKSLGAFAVPIKLHIDVETSINVEVQPSEESTAKEKKEEEQKEPKAGDDTEA